LCYTGTLKNKLYLEIGDKVKNIKNAEEQSEIEGKLR
jgi:hypothetical protein